MAKFSLKFKQEVAEKYLEGELSLKVVAVFVEIAALAIVMLEQQLCRSGNIHGAESTGLQGTGKGRRRQPALAPDVLILCRGSAAVGLGATTRAARPSAGAGVDVQLELKGG